MKCWERMPRRKGVLRDEPERSEIDAAVGGAWEAGWRAYVWRLPRTRGDRPPAYMRLAFGRAAPPHARGSTRLEGIRRCGGHGSPARAGIDRRMGAHHWVR